MLICAGVMSLRKVFIAAFETLLDCGLVLGIYGSELEGELKGTERRYSRIA